MQSKLFVNGEWTDASSGAWLDVIDPATEETFHRVQIADATDVDLAVEAARQAFDAWRKTPAVQRADLRARMADLIDRDLDALAELEVRDNGKPLPEATWDIEDTAACFRLYADMIREQDRAGDQTVVLSDDRFTSRVVREPVGVAAAIIPWNFPMLMAAWKVAPALAAGCTMVLKPSELTPLTALELARLAQEAGVPPGVLNVITGPGTPSGKALAEHPGIDKIAFTGSVPTGRQVMQAAAAGIKTVSLELGGKSPMIVFGDTDIEQAVEWIMFGIFWNQGEVCSATSRVLIEDSAYRPILERLVDEARKIRIGPGREDGVLLGPLVSKSQHDKVLAAIAQGQQDGATIASGGRVPQDLPTGYYVEPTIVTDAPLDSAIWRDEVFGPVVCLRSFKTEQEAIALANDSAFGLAGAVMSSDLDRANRVAAELRAGIVWVNCSQPTFLEAPWGGYKTSGIGRELGEWGLSNYQEVKQITSFDREHDWGWYLRP